MCPVCLLFLSVNSFITLRYKHVCYWISIFLRRERVKMKDDGGLIAETQKFQQSEWVKFLNLISVFWFNVQDNVCRRVQDERHINIPKIYTGAHRQPIGTFIVEKKRGLSFERKGFTTWTTIMSTICNTNVPMEIRPHTRPYVASPNVYIISQKYWKTKLNFNFKSDVLYQLLYEKEV